jgi:putative ABC transport system permease protein
MIGPALARDRGLDIGDTLTVPGRYGEVTFTVGGIWASTSGVGRSITTTAAQMREVTGPRPPDRLQVVPIPGTSAIRLADEIRAAHLDPRLIVLDPQELARSYTQQFASLAGPFRAMQWGILLVALVATASTLLLSAVQRRRENGILAALGMAPGDLARSTMTETLLLAGVATVIAALGAQVMLVCFSWASELMTSLQITAPPRPGGFVIAAVTAAIVALVGAGLPAWRANRADPVLALREG